MLRIHKLTPGAKGNGATYYTELASKDLAAYYAGSGEAPGVWLGGGLDDLMVTMNHTGKGVAPNTTMDADGAKLFEYLNSKQSAIDLFPPQRHPSKETGGEWVSGYDFTFSAPKGLSMLATMTNREDLRRAIYEAHDQAVKNAMAAIEDDICYGREGKAGKNLVKGGGLIAAAFRHRTARPAHEGDIPDPHLHSHVVVANMVRHPDGTYGALDGRAITAIGNHMALATGALYRTELLSELEKRGIYLEWEFTGGKNGVMDIAGIPDELIKAFSSRQAVIEEELERAGMISTKANLIARQKTQKAKDKEVASASDADLSTLLRTKLESLGWTAERLDRLLQPNSLFKQLTQKDIVDVANTLLVPPGTLKDIPEEHLTLNQATFSYWDMVQKVAVAASVKGNATIAEIKKAVDTILATGGVVELTPNQETSGTWQRRFTTYEILELEEATIKLAFENIHKPPRVNIKDLDATALTDEQKAMCLYLLGSKRKIDVVVGAAGTGKTHALKRVCELYQINNLQVVGCAKSGRAAEELNKGAAIETFTIDKLLRDARKSKATNLKPGCMVIVDEAGMAGTRQLAELARYVDRAGGKLVLVGDDKQLGAIDAGGLFGHLVEVTDHVELTRNVRNEKQAEILAKLRLGHDTTAIIQKWEESNTLHILPDKNECLHSLLSDWENDLTTAKQVTLDTSIMLADTRHDVELLNRAARIRRIERKEIDEGIQIGDNSFSVGDWVMTTRNNKIAGVTNGTRGIIKEISDRSLVIQLTDGTERILTRRYAEDNLTYAYAFTVHKAQGMTCENAHVLASDMLSRESGYVAMSRAKNISHIYAIAPDDWVHDPEGTTHGHELSDDRKAQELLASHLTHARNEQAASKYLVQARMEEEVRKRVQPTTPPKPEAVPKPVSKATKPPEPPTPPAKQVPFSTPKPPPAPEPKAEREPTRELGEVAIRWIRLKTGWAIEAPAGTIKPGDVLSMPTADGTTEDVTIHAISKIQIDSKGREITFAYPALPSPPEHDVNHSNEMYHRRSDHGLSR